MVEQEENKQEENKQEENIKTEEVIEKEEKPELETKEDTFQAEELDEEKIVVDNITKHQQKQLDNWHPKTELGKMIKSGEISDIDDVFKTGKRILEVEIIDVLFPSLESDLMMIGQSKGKFGGGAKRVFKQTQKKTKEGNKPSFATMAVVGNKDGYVGIGYGKAKETVPAREKALKRAKLNLFPIIRGSGSWLSSTSEAHSIPFAVSGKCGSVKITLMPAPVGKGLVIEKECKKILELAGIKDIWSKTTGFTKTKVNLIKACEAALKKLNTYKITSINKNELSLVKGNKKLSE